MANIYKIEVDSTEYDLSDKLVRNSLPTKVSKTLKNQTLTLNSEVELYLWCGYSSIVITDATFTSAHNIDYKLDDGSWTEVYQIVTPYTIDVTDVNVIRFRGGGGASYPITLTVDMIATPDVKYKTLSWNLCERDDATRYLGQRVVSSSQTVGEPVELSTAKYGYTYRIPIAEAGIRYYYLCEWASITYGSTGYDNKYGAMELVWVDVDDCFISGSTYVHSGSNYGMPPTGAKYMYIYFPTKNGQAASDLSNLGFHWVTTHAENDHNDELIPSNSIEWDEVNLAVKQGITTNSITLTSAEKQAAQTWLGIGSGPSPTPISIQGFVTPEDYGAIGDGTTDDTDAIQDAFDTNKPVLFDNKSYLISGICDTGKNSMILGRGTTIICSGASAFRVQEDNVQINGFTFVNDANDTHDYCAIRVLECDGCGIYNCKFDGVYTGIEAYTNLTNIRVENCEITATKHMAWQFLDNVDGVVLKNCYIHHNDYSTGLSMASGINRNILIDGCRFIHNGWQGTDNVSTSGFNIHGGWYVTITNCVIQDNNGNGMDLSGHSQLETVRNRYITVANNKFIDNGNDTTYGGLSNLIIFSCWDTAIVNNIFSGAAYGCQIATSSQDSYGCKNIEIQGNLFNDVFETYRNNTYRGCIGFGSLNAQYKDIFIQNNIFNSVYSTYIVGAYITPTSAAQQELIDNIVIKGNDISKIPDNTTNGRVLSINISGDYPVYPYTTDMEVFSYTGTTITDMELCGTMKRKQMVQKIIITPLTYVSGAVVNLDISKARTPSDFDSNIYYSITNATINERTVYEIPIEGNDLRAVGKAFRLNATQPIKVDFYITYYC